MGLILITGGARSGKSSYAVQLAAESRRRVVYVATAEPLDAEMTKRIDQHRAERPPSWHTIEEPLHPCRAAREAAAPDSFVILDCLTLWVSNLLTDFDSKHEPAAAPARSAALEDLQCLRDLPTDAAVAVVTNEVGLGIVPDNALARAYRDLLGEVNQELALRADEVQLMVSGIALRLK